MRHPKLIIAGVGLAAVAAVAGVTAAAAGGSSASSSTAGHSATAATVRTASATVAGKTETILVNSGGLPLYFYRADTAAKSFVTGGVAALWPPLTSAAPTAAGASGRLTVVNDTHGHQVAYNGHLLYTFISDHAGQVTGQGVQNFFVATPGLTSIASSSAPAGAVPAAPSAHGY
jgi:predicted lipoprotein with Yx(FWY)xxD motif